jgi:hypothetical protein
MAASPSPSRAEQTTANINNQINSAIPSTIPPLPPNTRPREIAPRAHQPRLWIRHVRLVPRLRPAVSIRAQFMARVGRFVSWLCRRLGGGHALDWRVED